MYPRGFVAAPVSILALLLAGAAHADVSAPSCLPPDKPGNNGALFVYPAGAVPPGVEPEAAARARDRDDRHGERGPDGRDGDPWLDDAWLASGGDALSLTVANQAKAARTSVVLVVAIPADSTDDDIEAVRIGGGDDGTVTIPRAAFGRAPGNPFAGKHDHGIYAPDGALYAFYTVGAVDGAPRGARIGGTRALEVVPIAGDGARLHFDVFDCETGDRNMDAHDTTWEEPGCRLTIACPAPGTAECADDQGRHVLGEPTWTSTCEAAPALTTTQQAFYDYRFPDASTYTVGYRVANGTHEASCETTLTVADTAPATVSCVDGQILAVDDACAAVATPATANDACDGALDVSCAETRFSGVGVHAMTCSATDRTGNTSACSTSVSLFDTTAPDISCSPDQIHECAGPCATAATVSADAADNCSPVEIACPDGAGPFCLGDTRVTCTAVDDSGNSASCTSTVTVRDTTAPAATCEPDVHVRTSANTGAVCAAQLAPAASGVDVCDPAPRSACAPAGLALEAPGSATSTCTVTDGSGNAASCVQTLTLTDDTAPTIACPPPRTVSADAQCRATVVFDADGADNCPDVGDASCLPATVTFTEPGSASVDCGVADASGNRAACAATAAMIDDTAPTVTCPAPQTIECAGPCATAATVADPAAEDNCAVAATGCAPGTGDYCLGTTTNTCHAVDPSGNRAECQTTVTVVDTTAPEPRCAAPASEIAGEGAMAAAPDMVLGADDACQPGELTVTQDPPAGTRLPLGDHLVTVTATDPAGNTATCDTIFTVRGILVPAAPYGEVLVYADAGEQGGHPCLSGPAPLPWPGTEDAVTVTACFADDFQTVVSVDFAVEAVVEPVGALLLEGEYDADLDRLCLSQVTDIVFEGLSTPITVTACLGSDGSTIETLAFHGEANLPPVGEVSLTGTYAPATDLLCFTGTANVALPGVASDVVATVCLAQGATQLASVDFATTLVSALGNTRATGRYDAATGQVCFAGDLAVELLGSSVTTRAEACASFGESPAIEHVRIATDLELAPLGTAALRGTFGGDGPHCLSGELTGNVDDWLPLPGITLLGLSARACVEGGKLGDVSLDASLRIGEGASALNLVARGEFRGPTDVSFTLGLPEGTRWTPFADIPVLPEDLASLGFDTLRGTLALTAAGPSLELNATFGAGDGVLDLVPGLELSAVKAKGRLALVRGKPTFEVTLAGNATIPLGFDDLVFALEAKVLNTTLTFTGTVRARDGDLTLEPFRQVLGDGAFAIGLTNANSLVTVDLRARTVVGNINANAHFGLFGAAAQVGVDMELALGAAGWGLTIAGILQRIDVPLGDRTLSLGDYGHIILVGSTRDLKKYPLDLDGDPANGKEHKVDIVNGLTLIAKADLNFLDDIFPGANAWLTLRIEGAQKFAAAGRLELPLALIRPEFNFPSIHAAGFQEVEFDLQVSGSTAVVGVGGALFVEPIDRAGNVQPRIPARARFLVDTGPSLGGEIYLEGLWKDPLFIPNVGFMNPGLSAKFRVSMETGVPIPYPSSLGANGQAFVLKSGEWPATIELDELGNPVDLPPNVLTAGGTIYYDIAVTKSGICIAKACIPLPTIIARLDLQHLQLQDFVDLANRFREAGVALASLPGLERLRDALPAEALRPIELPLNIDVRKAQVGFSTHNVKLLGTRFSAGIRGALDVAVTVAGETKAFALDGYVHPEGLRLSGQMSPLTFIPGLAIVGDPYRRETAVGAGMVTAPDADGFDAARTLEAWVRTAGPGVVFRKHDGANGYELTVGAAAPAECEGGENCPPALTLAARVLRDGVASELRTEQGVVAPGVRTHVAFTLEEDGTATLYANGAAVATGDLPAPGASAAALEMGAGLTNIDDMRVWTTARAAAEIAGEPRVMPFRFRWDPSLVARYEGDLDTDGTAWNSRVGGPHAAYAGGAASVIAADDQDLYFKLMFELDQLAKSGLWFRGGAHLDWDPPLPGAVLTLGAEGALGDGRADGTLFVRELPMMDLGTLGKFKLGGDGPNAVPGDFDDGLYVSADFLKEPAPSVNASGRLYFAEAGGALREVASATVLFDCLRAEGCADIGQYTLKTAGDLDLDIPLGGAGTLEVDGHHTFTSDDMAFHVEGRLAALGRELFAADITIGRERATLSADMEIGDVAGVDFGLATSLDIDVVYQPARLCGHGVTNVLIGGLGAFEGEIDACVGDNPSVRFRGFGAAAINGIPLGNVDVEVDSANGVFIRDAFVNIPGLFSGRVQGHYRSEQDFRFTGTSDLNLPALVALRSTLTLAQDGATVHVEVNPGCGNCLVRATLDGDVAMVGGQTTWDLQGDAVVQVAGFTLSSGRVRFSNTGFAVSGNVDIGIGRANVAGSLDTNTGAYALSGDLAGSLFGGQITTSGAVALNNAGASANGAMKLFGSSGAFAAAVSPGHFTAQANMRLGIPTAAGTYDIGDGAVRLVHAPGSLTASVSGRFAVPGVSAALDGTLGDGTFAFTGQADLGPGVGSGTLRVTPAGASVDLSMQAPGFPAARFTGDVGADPGAFVVNGAIDIGGLPLSSSSIRIDGSHATFGTSVSLGSFLGVDLGAASLDLDMRYAPFSVCGTGRVEFPLDRSIACEANACLSFNGPLPWFTVNSLDCGLGICLGDAMCGENGFCDLIGRCHGKKGNDEPCAGLLIGDHECQSGFCDIWKTFPVPVCADPLPDGVGCIDDGQCASKHCGWRPGGLARHCYTPRTRGIGEECYDEQHCGVGQCWGSPFFGSRCLCVENGQCDASPNVPDGSVCALGDWSIGDAGFCVPPRTEGQGCRSRNECGAGLECGGGQCYRPQSRHNWEGCVVSEQCVSGMCWNGQCRCWEHGQCQADGAFGASSYCDMGTWLLGNNEGKCHAPKVHDGAYCEDGQWCQSGHCQNNRCYTPRSKHNWEVCNSNEECNGGLCWNGQCRCWQHDQCTNDPAFGPNSFCNLGDWLPWNDEGRCYAPKRGDGEWCEDGNWCASGACAGNRCYTRWSRHMGEGCIAGDQCTTGNCKNGICGCSTHAQCGEGNFCNYGSCETKRASNDHQKCDDGDWCESGLCGWSPKWLYNMCYTYADFGPGHWCDMDQNCRSGRCTWKVFVWTCD